MDSKKSGRKKLFIIDGYASLYRSHFALIRNPLITTYGLHTSALFGFLKQIMKIFQEEDPDYFACAFDSKEKTFRHKIFRDYKATRKPMPEEMQDQLPHLEESLWFHLCSSESHLSRRLGCSFPLEGSDPLDAIGLGWFESQSKALAALPCLTDSSRTTPEGLASNRNESSGGSLRALDLLPTYRSGNPVGLGNRDPIDRTAPWLRFLHLSAD